MQPTPADEHVDGEGGGVGVDDEQQHVQVETLHQQPEEVCHDEVVEEHQAGSAAHLQQQQQHHSLLHVCSTGSYNTTGCNDM